MTEIIPAILETDFAKVQKRLAELEGVTDWTQLDITDGEFAPNFTWSDPQALADLEGRLKVEVHLMVRRPELDLTDWLEVVDRVVFHIESVTAPTKILDQAARAGVPTGLALLAETPLERVGPFIEQIESVQLMGIAEIGKQGLPFDEGVIDRVRQLRQAYPDLKIAVDGGVDLNNAKALIEAGVDRLIVGSAWWQFANAKQAHDAWQELSLS
ncbi:MAG: hypothetical protein U9M92_00425 [Patescibacteria group bacterium]|nr:hypothetical protein [Patescibacteria group bacterium]